MRRDRAMCEGSGGLSQLDTLWPEVYCMIDEADPPLCELPPPAYIDDRVVSWWGENRLSLPVVHFIRQLREDAHS